MIAHSILSVPEFVKKTDTTEVIQGEFSLKNLGYFIKCTNLCSNIEMFLENDLPQNGPREHYMRAKMRFVNGTQTVEPFGQQDSSLLTILSKANALLVRPANDKAKQKGSSVKVIPLK